MVTLPDDKVIFPSEKDKNLEGDAVKSTVIKISLTEAPALSGVTVTVISSTRLGVKAVECTNVDVVIPPALVNVAVFCAIALAPAAKS